MEEKPLSYNLSMNFIHFFLNLFFPMVTFAYASRILGTTGVGIVNYTDSIIKYLVLLGGGGIGYYAVREVAGVRENHNRLAETAREMLCITVGLTIAAYTILALILLRRDTIGYTTILIIQSTVVLFNALGMEWLYTALEKYRYMAVRTACFQGIACLLLFLFVKNEKDYLPYALILVGASVCPQILNFIYAMRQLPIIGRLNLAHVKRHWQGAKYVFFANFAISVYLHIDKTMLGLMSGVETVGLYSAANYIIQAGAGILTCATNVVLPRISNYKQRGQIKEADKLLSEAGNILLLTAIPLSIGIACVGRPLLILLSGPQFEAAFPALVILSGSMFFAVINNFCIWQVLIPEKKEKMVFQGTVLSAVVNTVFNYILIPKAGMAGAAIATFFAECALTWFCRCAVGKKMKDIYTKQKVLQIMTAATSIIISSVVIDYGVTNILCAMVCKILVAGMLYIGVLWIMGNQYIFLLWRELNRLLRREGHAE